MRFRGTDKMALVLNATSGEQYREVSVAVAGPIAHAAAEHDQRVVEDLCFLQFGDEVAEFGGQEGFHDLQLTDSIFGLTVMREPVVTA